MATPRRSGTKSSRRTRTWARQYGSLSVTGADPATTPAGVLALYETDTGADVPEGTTFGGAFLTCALERATGSADDPPAVILGLRVASKLEDNVDIAPGDIVNGGIHQDWLFWHKLYLVGDGASPTTVWRRTFEFQIRAQRRIPTSQHTIQMAMQVPFGFTDDYDLSYAISSLLILP